MSKYYLIAAAAFVLAGCGSGSGDYGGTVASKSPAADSAKVINASAPSSEYKSTAALPRKIIYKGEISLVTERFEASAAKLESKAHELGGYVGDANLTGTKGTNRQGTWTIRIPSSQFDAFVHYAATLGELQSSKRETQDVSEEFYDIEARLKNKRVEEARLIDHLRHSTAKLADILTVEKEISRVREECDQIEGRLRFLNNQTDLSSITVTIQEVKEFVPQGSPTVKTQVARTFSGSIGAMKDLGLSLLLLVVALAPWLIFPAIAAFILVKKMKKPLRPLGPKSDPAD